jgi:bifunctional ADP-heptose synthase (sugar kinase/adenylyltransferase)
MLNHAASLGDYLLVCIDTDRRVRELKGPSRPINNQEDRKFHLLNLRCVDEVRFFDSKEELQNIFKEYDPYYIVKGGDWRGKSSTAAKYCKEVIFYDRIGEYSTTNTIQDIISRG